MNLTNAQIREFNKNPKAFNKKYGLAKEDKEAKANKEDKER